MGSADFLLLLLCLSGLARAHIDPPPTPSPKPTPTQAHRQIRQAFQVSEISIQVTAPLFTGRLYEFGKDAGDKALHGGVDVATPVDLTHPVSYFGVNYDRVYITSNGAVGFKDSSKKFQTIDFPDGPRLISPFYNQNDLSKGGNTFYRQVTKGRVVDRAESEVRYQYEKRVEVQSVLVVTWVDVHPVQDLGAENYEPNTFQAAIISTGNGTFVNYIYKKIGWSQGAQAAFNEGDGSNTYILPDADANAGANILLLAERGNTGIPGEWMFQVDMPKIVRCKMGIRGDLCDQKCAEGRWGYDCGQCCHCASGSCAPDTGTCKVGDRCTPCWLDEPTCQRRDQSCRVRPTTCGHNAISLTEEDECGEPVISCRCLNGYVGDGKTCTDIDECDSTATCDANAVCVNTPGKFYCQCLQGFTGDGKTCNEEFLYPYENHHALPKSLDVRAPWRLEKPIRVFNKTREKLWISSNGLVTFQDPKSASPAALSKGNANMRGFIPYFARVDLTKGGQVTAAESADTGVLTRATKTIMQKYGMGNFVASTVFIVTFSNVRPHVNSNDQKENSFQIAIIRGKDGRDEPVFVEYIYEKLEWSNGAKAMILADDPVRALELPGSGNSASVQLKQLSNIDQPGHWLFRVDSDQISPCPSPEFAPPYCQEKKPRSAVLPAFGGAIKTETPTIPFTSSTELLVSTPTSDKFEPQTPLPTRRAGPTLVTGNGTVPSLTQLISTTTDETVYTFDLPDFINIVPELVTHASEQPAVVSRGESENSLVNPTLLTGGSINIVPNVQPINIVPQTPPQHHLLITSSTNRPPETSAARTTARPEIPIQIVTATHRPIAPQLATQANPSTEPPPPTTTTLRTFRPSTVFATAPPFRKITTPAVITWATPPPRPSSTPRRYTANPNLVFGHTVAPTVNKVSYKSPKLHIFTTTPRTPAPRTTTKKVSAKAKVPPFNFHHPSIVRKPPTKTAKPPYFDDEKKLLTNYPLDPSLLGKEKENITDPNTMAIVIPTVIVGVWLLLLIVIGLVICWRRRGTMAAAHGAVIPGHHRGAGGGKYDPYAQITMMAGLHQHPSATGGAGAREPPGGGRNGGAGGTKDISVHSNALARHQHHASYEDHLDKAARISEMNQYGQNSRAYGSYWQMQAPTGSSAAGQRNSGGNTNNSASYYNQGYYESCPDFSSPARYSFGGGRY